MELTINVEKLENLLAIIDNEFVELPEIDIEVDGGIGLQNASQIVEAGADAIVAGASVFASENPLETMKALKTIGANN